MTASTQTTEGAPFGFGYQYNVDDSLKTSSYPSGRSVSYSFDPAGRVSAVAGYASSVAYAPQGAIAQVALANGVVESWTYSQRLQAQTITAAKAGTLVGLTYGYAATGNNGNVLSQTINAAGLASFTQSYQYDGVNRLEQVQETASGAASGSWWAGFGYGPYGNRWVSGASFTLNVATPVAQSQYNEANNRLAKTSDNQPLPADAYDGAGDLRNHPWVGQMSYDWDNRLVQFVKAGSVTDLAYDGEGRRVKKVSPTETRVYIYDAQGQLAAEYGPLAAIGGRQYLTADHLGSTRLVTDENGAVKQRRDYLPFGEEILASSSFGNRQVVKDGQAQTTYNAPYGPTQQFTGKERDSESGLDFFEARYFSSPQGRFTSPDAMMGKPEWLVDPQRWNRYAYVRNDPLKYIDPNGEDLVVYYWLGSDVSDADREWFERNKTAVLAQIKARYENAGVRNVRLRELSTLSKEQVAALDKNAPFGVARLIFAGKDYPGLGPAPMMGVLGYAHPDNKRIAAVFLDTFARNAPAGCDYTCIAANVGAHEIGHTLGIPHLGFFEEMADRWRQRPVMLGGTETRPDLMTGSMGTPMQPLYFKPGTNEKTRRAIEQLNRIGDMTPKK